MPGFINYFPLEATSKHPAAQSPISTLLSEDTKSR